MHREFSKQSTGLNESLQKTVPSRKGVYDFLRDITAYLFPLLSENDDRDSMKSSEQVMASLAELLSSYNNELKDVDDVVSLFEGRMDDIYQRVMGDATAICEGDPAARSTDEVIVTYPGFYAILVYRIAHELDALEIATIPRMLTEYAHRLTGIDIHPSAKIGQSFCIDHGTGIVIGETTEIGNSVKMYQGVTLGASSVSKDKAGTKRHPTIENNVIIYSGSTILGGKTVIGHHSVVGGNVWLTHSIKPHSLVINRSEVHLIDQRPDGDRDIDFVI